MPLFGIGQPDEECPHIPVDVTPLCVEQFVAAQRVARNFVPGRPVIDA
jgi:hypothetical protein